MSILLSLNPIFFSLFITLQVFTFLLARCEPNHSPLIRRSFPLAGSCALFSSYQSVHIGCITAILSFAALFGNVSVLFQVTQGTLYS